MVICLKRTSDDKGENMDKDKEIQNQDINIEEMQQEHTHGDIHTHPHAHAEHSHSHGGHHKHVHNAAEKKAVINRLSRVIGHLEAVKRMVERDEDCSEVLIQLAAVRSAINNTGKVVLKNHLNHCIVHAVEEGDDEAIELLNQAIDKFVK